MKTLIAALVVALGLSVATAPADAGALRDKLKKAATTVAIKVQVKIICLRDPGASPVLCKKR